MVAFDTYQGFLILLVFPLLLIYRRRMTRVKPVTMSILPVIEAVLTRHPTNPPHLFRLKRKYQALLYATALFLIVLAFNGTHIPIEGEQVGEWLIILDNSYTQTIDYQNKTLLERSRTGIKRLLNALPSRDTLTLMTSAPEPELFHHLKRGELVKKIQDVEASTAAPTADSLLDTLVEIIQEKELKGIIPITTRDPEWRKAASEVGLLDKFHFPPVRETLIGNAGIVDFELSPSADTGGKYDLFFRIQSSGVPDNRIEASLKIPDDRTVPIPLEVDERGTARYFETGLEIPKGKVVLSLNIRDTLPADNTVSALVLGDIQIPVAFRGQPHPFFEEAVRSHKGFRIADQNRGNGPTTVDVYIGTPPGGVIERPSLIIRPTEDFLGFSLLGQREKPSRIKFDNVHPATRNIRFRNFRPPRIIDFRGPPNYEVLARSGDAPLIFAGAHSRQRVMVWSFDPLGGGIFLDPSFIILLRDSLEWLSETSPVVWTSMADCNGSGHRVRPEANDIGVNQNILCAGITGEAGLVTVPDLVHTPLRRGSSSYPYRIDLAPWFLMFASVLLFYLSAVEAFQYWALAS